MDNSDIMRELRQLGQRLDDFSVPNPPQKSSLPEVTIQKDPPQNSSNLKPTSFPTYDGDRASYPGWRRAILSAMNRLVHVRLYRLSRFFDDLKGA